jgi:hypothetical protein
MTSTVWACVKVFTTLTQATFSASMLVQKQSSRPALGATAGAAAAATASAALLREMRCG